MDDTSPTAEGKGSGEEHSDSPEAQTIVVGERYERTTHLFSTRAAEGFEAIEKTTGEKSQLWLLRFPLGEDSEEARRFVRRLESLSALDVAMPSFKKFGVDSTGTAFLAMDYVDARPLTAVSGSPKELEQLFLSVLKILSPIHQNGIFLGDISEDTFVVDSSEKVLLIGVMGTFDAGARQTAMLPPADTLHYLAPEQRNGSGPDVACDVYALGVYGYRLFTGRYLSVDKQGGVPSDNPVARTPAPSVVRSELSPWVDDVLGRCLEVDPIHRYRDTQEMLEVVEEAITSGVAPGGKSAWSRRTMKVPRPSMEENKEIVEAPESQIAKKQEAKAPAIQKRERSMAVFVWIAALTVGILAAGFVYYFLEAWDLSSSTGPEEPVEEDVVGEDPIRIHAQAAPSELQPLILELSSSTSPIEERENALVLLAESSDPVAYGVMVAVVKSSNEPQLRQTARELLLDRIRKQGFQRSAQVMEKWFKDASAKGKEAGDSPAFGQLLPASDPVRSFEVRKMKLQRAYELEPAVTLQLVGALALDESEEEFVPVLRMLLAAEMPDEDLTNRGLGALLLSDSRFSELVSQDVEMTLQRFSDEDLRWALQHRGNDRKLLYDLASEAVHRKMLTPYHTVFLEYLIEGKKAKISSLTEHALIKAAVGNLEKKDVQVLGAWISLATERVLFAVCATAKEQAAAVAAFDILAGRSLKTEPGKSIVPWLRQKFWDYRKQVAKAVGILGLADIAAKEDLDRAFEMLLPFAPGGLFRVISHTDNDYLTYQAVTRLGAITRSDDLLPMLRHPNKEVRMAAVKALGGRNELPVLQAILRSYEKEKDEEVRAVYRKAHWVTKNRTQAGKKSFR